MELVTAYLAHELIAQLSVDRLDADRQRRRAGAWSEPRPLSVVEERSP